MRHGMRGFWIRVFRHWYAGIQDPRTKGRLLGSVVAADSGLKLGWAVRRPSIIQISLPFLFSSRVLVVALPLTCSTDFLLDLLSCGDGRFSFFNFPRLFLLIFLLRFRLLRQEKDLLSCYSAVQLATSCHVFHSLLFADQDPIHAGTQLLGNL